MIALRRVTKGFGNRVVLENLTLELPDGTVTALVGPNGSGKTTVGRMLLGLSTPDSGTVEGVDGLRRAAVFQEERLCPQLSAIDNVRLVLPGQPSDTAVTRSLLAVGLDDESARKPARLLSGGQQRLVALVRGLLAPADIVVLDEPFTNLDPSVKALALTWAHAQLRGRTTLLITHDPAEAQSLDATVVSLTGSNGPEPRRPSP